MIDWKLNNQGKKKISFLAITNLQRKFDKLLFSYLLIRVENFSKQYINTIIGIYTKQNK